MKINKKILSHTAVICGAVILIVFLFFPLIFQSGALFDEDTVTYDYPATFFYSQVINSGEEKISWNPYYLGGFPTYLSPVGNYIDPLYRSLLYSISDPFTVHHLRLFISIFLALVFSYYFARSIKLSKPASILVSLGYITAPTLGYLTGSLSISGALFFLPAGLLFVRLLHKKRGKIPVAIAGAVLIFAGALFGFAQAIFYSFLYVFSYSIYLTLQRSGQLFSLERWKNTLIFLAATVAGTTAALPFWKDTVLFRTLTERTTGFGSSEVGGMHMFDIPYFFIPDYLSVSYLHSDFLAGFYIGAPMILLAILSFFLLKKNKDIRFYFSVYGITILFLITPLGLGYLLQQLPIFSLFHTIKRLLLPASFFLLLAAAHAFDVVRANRFDLNVLSRYFRVGVIVLSLFLLIAVAPSIASLVLPVEDPSFQATVVSKITSVPIDTVPHDYLLLFKGAVNEFFSTFSLLNWKFIAPILLFPLSFLTLFLYKRRQISLKVFTIGFVVLMFLNTVVVYGAQYDRYIPRKEFKKRPVIANIISRFSAGEDYYLGKFLVGDALFRNIRTARNLSASEQFITARESLASNLNVIYNIPYIEGYEPYTSSRHRLIWDEVVKADSLQRERGEGFDSALERQKKEFLDFLPLLSSYNVGYILSGYELNDPRLVVLKRIPILEQKEKPLFLYQNTEARRKVYIPSEIVIQQRDARISTDDIKHITPESAIIECDKCEPATVRQNGRVRMLESSPGYIRFKSSMNKSGWVIIAQSNLPGWRAYIDNKELSIHTANYLIQAIFAPEGAHEITLIHSGGL